jgi:hypothetical protein
LPTLRAVAASRRWALIRAELKMAKLPVGIRNARTLAAQPTNWRGVSGSRDQVTSMTTIAVATQEPTTISDRRAVLGIRTPYKTKWNIQRRITARGST